MEMTAVVGTVTVNRHPDEVFDYIADPVNRVQWQEAVKAIEPVSGEHAGVGARVRETRRTQGRPRTYTFEVTDYVLGRRWGTRGVRGPVRPLLTVTLTPHADGAATEVRTELDFARRGIGMLLAPLARWGARREMPRDCACLKRKLESSAPSQQGWRST
jgi:uncharacterized protein YndB with AHSA1/START domain